MIETQHDATFELRNPGRMYSTILCLNSNHHAQKIIEFDEIYKECIKLFKDKVTHVISSHEGEGKLKKYRNSNHFMKCKPVQW